MSALNSGNDRMKAAGRARRVLESFQTQVLDEIAEANEWSDSDLAAYIAGRCRQIVAEQVEGEIKFHNKHVGPILDGEKILTVRYRPDWGVEEGDRARFVTPDGTLFAVATINKRSTMTARKFVRSKLDGHRTYDSVGNFLTEMERYYPDVPLQGNTRFEVIWFEEVYQL